MCCATMTFWWQLATQVTAGVDCQFPGCCFLVAKKGIIQLLSQNMPLLRADPDNPHHPGQRLALWPCTWSWFLLQSLMFLKASSLILHWWAFKWLLLRANATCSPCYSGRPATWYCTSGPPCGCWCRSTHCEPGLQLGIASKAVEHSILIGLSQALLWLGHEGLQVDVGLHAMLVRVGKGWWWLSS